MASTGIDPAANGVRCFEFGEFRLEPATRLLLRSGAPVSLTPRAFDLLHVLVENRARVVTKDELLRAVWSDVIVEEANLTQHVFMLRKILGDHPDRPCFIATVPRRGYRFVADVREGDRATSERSAAPARGRSGAPTRRWPAVALLAIAGGAVALVGGATVLMWAKTRTPAPAPPVFHRLTFRHQGFDRARFTPDGRAIVLDARWDGDRTSLYQMAADGSAPRPLGIAGARIVRMSPAGQLALLVDEPAAGDSALALVSSSGGEPRRLIEHVDLADWAPDTGEFAVVHRGGGRSRLEFPAGTPIYDTAAWLEAVKISPDRQAVAFLEHPVANDTRGFVTVVDRQGRRRVVSREWPAVFGLVWAPGGHELWFGKFDARVHAIAASDGSGRERDLYRGPEGLILHDAAADGRVLATQFTFHGGVIWHPAGGAAERDLSLFGVTRSSAIAEDGSAIVLTAEDEGPESPTYAVYLQRAGATSAVRLGEGSAQDLSPDGARVLAIDFRAPAHLVLFPAAGGGPRILAPGPIEQFHRAHWLPDGRRVVFEGNEAGRGVRLYVQAITDAAPAAITPEGYTLDAAPASPDGRFVICRRAQDPLSRCPVSGGPIERLRGVEPGEQAIRWSHDGRQLHVFRRTPGPLRAVSVDIRTGERAAWRDFTLRGSDTLRDLRQLFIAAGDPAAYAFNYVRTTNDLFLVDGLR